MPNRRQFLRRAAVASTCAGALSPAFAWNIAERFGALFESPKGTLTVVLVDTTASIDGADWALYERAVQALLQRTAEGDRIVLSTVSDRPASKFVAHADHAFTPSGNSLQDGVRKSRMQAAVATDLAALRAVRSAPARGTWLVDAIGASAELFATARGKGQATRLLILSDMIEESPLVNMAREVPDERATARLLDSLHERRVLPKLTGVQVHVVGASGRSAMHMARIRAFWEAYFAAAGAQLASYGRAADALRG